MGTNALLVAVIGMLVSGLVGCGSTASPVTSNNTPVVATAKSIWVAAWADAPDSLGGTAGSEQTFREVVKPTVGSRGTVRVHFSNFFGTSAVTLGAVHVGVQKSGPAVTGDVALTFNGAGSVVIPAGGFVTSDQVALSFNYGDILEVTEYVSGSWTKLTQHTQANGAVRSYATANNAGNKTTDTTGASFTQNIIETLLLDRVDVYGPYTGTIATLGGSTTDGLGSDLDKHNTYPEQLAAALHGAGRDDVAIANVGINGNTLLGAGVTPGVGRFSRDVAALPGITGVIDYLGANDLRGICLSAAAVISGKQNLIAQANAAGIKIYEGVIAPSTFCNVQNPAGFGTRFPQGYGQEAQRTLLNAWLLSTQSSVVGGATVQPPGAAATIDFSSALSDPSNLSYMLPAFDFGDDVHPNPAGYAAMVKAIPLTLF